MKKDKMKETLSKKLKTGNVEFTAREVLLIKEILLKDELDKYNLEIKDMDKFSDYMKENLKNEHKYTNRKVNNMEIAKFVILFVLGIFMGILYTMFLIRLNSIENVKFIYLGLLFAEISLIKALEELNLDVKIPDLQNKEYHTIYKITNMYWRIFIYATIPIIAYITMTIQLK